MVNRQKLKKVGKVEIFPIPPFNFDAAFHKPAHFPSGDTFWQPGVNWHTYFWQDK